MSVTPTFVAAPADTRKDTRAEDGIAHLVVLVLVVLVVALFIAAAVGTRHDAAVQEPAQTVASGTGRAYVDLAAIARSTDRSVVDITATLGAGRGTVAATGLVLSASGTVLTNNHVIAGATQITAQVGGTGRRYAAGVAGYDVTADLAVLQLDGASGLTPARLGDPATARIGDGVAVIGNAHGLGGPPRTRAGVIAALRQRVNATDNTGQNGEDLSGLIEVAASVQPGDSGGPLVNGQGKVIGLTTAASVDNVSANAERGFAIPIDRAAAVAAQIGLGRASATVHIGDRAILGVAIKTVRSSPAVARVAGAVIGLVDISSPARAAGVRADDVITAVDNVEITSVGALDVALDRHHPGDVVRLSWTDASGRFRTASVGLITGPPL